MSKKRVCYYYDSKYHFALIEIFINSVIISENAVSENYGHHFQKADWETAFLKKPI